MSNPDNLCTIFVNNLPWSVDDNFLKETFAKNGEITDCYVALRGTRKTLNSLLLPPLARLRAPGASGITVAPLTRDSDRRPQVAWLRLRDLRHRGRCHQRAVGQRHDAQGTRRRGGSRVRGRDRHPALARGRGCREGSRSREGRCVVDDGPSHHTATLHAPKLALFTISRSLTLPPP